MRESTKSHPLVKNMFRERDRQAIKSAFNVLYEDSPLNRKRRAKRMCPFLQHSRGKQMDVIFNAESRLLTFKRGPF